MELLDGLAVLLAGAGHFLWPRRPLILILNPKVGAATQVGQRVDRVSAGADSRWVGCPWGCGHRAANLVAMATQIPYRLLPGGSY